MGKRTTRQHNAKTQKDKTPQNSSDSTIPKQEKTLSSQRRTAKRLRRQNSSVSSFSAAGLKTQNSDEPAPVFSDASRSTHANATGCLDVPVYFQQSALCQLLAGNESPAAMNSGYQMYPILATEQQSQSREATIDVSASASGRPGESTFGVSGGAENRETCSRRLEELMYESLQSPWKFLRIFKANLKENREKTKKKTFAFLRQ